MEDGGKLVLSYVVRPLRLLAIGVCVICVAACSRSSPPPPSTASQRDEVKWDEIHLLRVKVEDRRGVGNGDYRVQVIPLVVLDSGKVLCPIVEVRSPRKGSMDRVTYEQRRQAVLLGAGEGSTIAVPLDRRIGKYVFLVRSLSEDSGWRVLELGGREKAAAEVLAIPDLLTLPVLDQRADRDRLWGEYQRAEKEFEEAEGHR